MTGPEERLFLSAEQLRDFCAHTETPFFLYDARTLRQRAALWKDAFSFCRYRLSFPVRALSNPHVLRVLRQQGVGAVCANAIELELARRAGYERGEIIYLMHRPEKPPRGVQLILDDPAQLRYLPKRLSVPVGLRFAPARDVQLMPMTALRTSRSQFGMDRDQLTEAALALVERGCPAVGIHAQFATGRMEKTFYRTQAEQLFEAALHLRRWEIPLAYCDLGGGIGWSDSPGCAANHVDNIGADIRALCETMLSPAGLGDLELRSQIGRSLAAPAGIFVTRVESVREKSCTILNLDGSSSDLMRHLLYGACYGVSILSMGGERPRTACTVCGWLQEPGDRFVKMQVMSRAEPGDLCIFHGVGAYGAAMASPYGGNLRCAEYLLDGEIRMIRRGERPSEYFATLIP